MYNKVIAIDIFFIFLSFDFKSKPINLKIYVETYPSSKVDLCRLVHHLI